MGIASEVLPTHHQRAAQVSAASAFEAFFAQIQDLVADSLRLKSTRFRRPATGSNLSPKIWLLNEVGAWVGGVFQLETVDGALLVICYPGIWIDPKP